MTLINCQLKGVLCGCRLSSGQQLVSPLAQFQLREVEDLQPSLVTATAGIFTTKGWFQQSMGVCSSFLFEGRKGALLTVSAAQGQPRAVLLNTAKPENYSPQQTTLFFTRSGILEGKGRGHVNAFEY